VETIGKLFLYISVEKTIFGFLLKICFSLIVETKKLTKGTKILEDTQGDSSYGGIMTLA
jgi:hypothetical protein